MKKLKVGDHIVYRKQKASSKPGPRARKIAPSEHGETYWYFVDKYWTVSSVQEDGSIDVVTRRGKVHRLRADDPCLRRSNLVDELLHRQLFPSLPAPRRELEREG